MNLDSMGSFITAIGFPSSLVVFLLWYIAKYINKKDEQNREDTNRQIQELKKENRENLKSIREESHEREIESRKREDKLQSIIAKNQEVISDLATKFDVIKDVKNKVEEIEEQVCKISEKMDK